jgi:AraC-like DNA-binding protein
MSEFASMAMMRVISQGMLELGIPPPQTSGAAMPRRGSTVELDAKLTLLTHAIKEGGVECLVLLGRGVHHFADEPTHRAMTSAGSPAALLLRWQRLEKYIHSLHHIDLIHVGESHAHVVHRANRPDTCPSLAEDLVVAGVLAGLLEAMGTQNLTIHCGPLAIYPVLNKCDLAALDVGGTSSSWTFRWQSIAPQVQPQSSVEPVDLFHADQWPEIARCVGNTLVQELMLPPALPEMAKRMAVSSRSLQRNLAHHGLSYSQLLSEARSRMAAWRLLETPASLAEVGFLSGYSDQPHFTREFRLLVGVTPAQYRKDFSLAP